MPECSQLQLILDYVVEAFLQICNLFTVGKNKTTQAKTKKKPTLPMVVNF